MVGHLLNSQKGETMADEPTVSDEDVADVSLIDTPIAAAGGDEPAESAEPGKDDAAEPAKDEPPTTPQPSDAKTTEAKEPEAKPVDTDQAAEDQPAEEPAPAQTKEEREAAARQAWQNRQRTRQQIAQQIDQSFGPRSEEEIVEQDGLSPLEAQMAAFREEQAYKEQRTAIAELNVSLRDDGVSVLQDFPVYNDKSPDYDPDFTKKVEAAYKTAARIETQRITNPDGSETEIVTNAEIPLYDFYKQMNDIYSRGKSSGAQQGQQDTAEMLSRVENPGGSSSTQSGSGDSLEELEERLGDVVIT